MSLSLLQSRCEFRVIVLNRFCEVGFHIIPGCFRPEIQIIQCLVELPAENML